MRTRENRKEGTDRNVNVNVARAVQGVERHQVWADRQISRDRQGGFHFFACHAAHAPGANATLDHKVVTEDIQLLLDLALYVCRAGYTQNAGHITAGHFKTDFFTGFGNIDNQLRELRIESVLGNFVIKECVERLSLHGQVL